VTRPLRVEMYDVIREIVNDFGLARDGRRRFFRESSIAFACEGGSRRLVASAAKAQHRVENRTQEGQSRAERGALTEVLCDVDAQQQYDEQIDERNEDEDSPPQRQAGDVEQNHDVIERNRAEGRKAGGYAPPAFGRSGYRTRAITSRVVNKRRSIA
jgi:hypothetical protein